MSENSETADSVDLDELTRRVIEVISSSQEVPIEKIELDTTFEDLGFDSLDGVNLAFDLEEEFDIEIPDDAVRFIGNVREVVDNVRLLLDGGEEAVAEVKAKAESQAKAAAEAKAVAEAE